MIFKKITLLFFASVFLLSCSKKATPTPSQPNKPIIPEDARWKQVKDITLPSLFNILSFSIGSKGYVISQGELYGQPPNFWEYDSDGDKWTKKTAYPGVGKDHLVCFIAGGKAYVGIGYNDPYQSSGLTTELYGYDPATDKWTKKADFPGGVRTGSVAFATQGSGYIGLGGTNVNQYTDLWKYDIANNSWSKAADYPGKGKFSCISFSGSSKAYVGMGTNAFSELINDDFWEYDSITDKWTQKARFIGVSRTMSINFMVGGQPYFGLGWGRNEHTTDFWKYDVANNNWLQESKYPDSDPIQAVSFLIGNSLYVGGGAVYDYTSSINKHFWKFTP